MVSTLYAMMVMGSLMGAPHDVRVVDEAGLPIPGATVYAIHTYRPLLSHLIPIPGAGGASTTVRGPIKTGRDGRARVRIHRGWVRFVAEAPGLPMQGESGELTDVPRTIILGPPRPVSGHVLLPAGCATEELSVMAVPDFNSWDGRIPGPQASHAKVMRDGRFVLEGLGPQAYHVMLDACGQRLRERIVGARRELDLTLALEDAAPWSVPPPPPAVLALRPSRSHPVAERVLELEADTVAAPPGRRDVVLAFGSPAPRGSDGRGQLRTARSVRDAGRGRYARVLQRDASGIAWTVEDPTLESFVWFARADRVVSLGDCSGTVLRGRAAACWGYDPARSSWSIRLATDDGDVQTLTDDSLSHFVLTGDGERLAYLVLRPVPQLRVRDVRSGTDKILPFEASAIAAFDGDHALVLVKGGLWRVDLRAGAVEPLSPSTTEGVHRFWASAESPAVVAMKSEEVWVIGSAGSTAAATRRISEVLFSGDHVVLLAQEEFGGGGTDATASVVNLKTREERTLAKGITSSHFMAIRPGKVILRESATARVLVCELERAPSCRALTTGILREVSPDGTWLLVEQSQSPPQMRLVRSDGGGHVSLGHGWGGFSADSGWLLFKRGWRPDAGPLSAIRLGTLEELALSTHARGFGFGGSGEAVFSQTAQAREPGTFRVLLPPP